MGIDFAALAQSAETVEELAPATKVSALSPFHPVVIASLKDGKPKQIGPVSRERPDKDSDSPFDEAHKEARRAAGKVVRDRKGTANPVKVTVRKIVGEDGDGYIQVYAEPTTVSEDDESETEDATVTNVAAAPSETAGRRSRRAG